jgi:hypothetical protein
LRTFAERVQEALYLDLDRVERVRDRVRTLADYRGMAERLGSPRLLPTARRFIAAAAAVRQRSRTADYGDECDDRCR